MKRLKYLMMLIVCVWSLEAAAAESRPQATWGLAVPVTAQVAPTPVADALVGFQLREGLTLRERRAMGLTIANVKRILLQLKEAELIDEDTTVEEAAVIVASQLVADAPAAFQDPGIDWEAILAFLEKLIPLILQIIAIFS